MMQRYLLPFLLTVMALGTTAQAQQTSPFDEELNEIAFHIAGLSDGVPDEDVGKLGNLLFYLEGVLKDGASTPAIRHKMIEVIRCGMWEIFEKNFLELNPEDDEAFLWMIMLTQDLDVKAIFLDIVKIFFPPLPPPPPMPAPSCTVDILVYDDNSYDQPPDSGIRFDSFNDIGLMKALARDENGNDITATGTFEWSVTPMTPGFGHSVTPRAGTPFAHTEIDTATAINSIKAGVRGFATQYKVHVKFTAAGPRVCEAWMDVTARIREPPTD